jgi:NitT/TauT family transport system substrate-binding protein
VARSRYFFLASIFTIILSLAGPAHAETTVKLASAQKSIGSLAVVIAELQGFFKEAGLKVDVIDFQGGGPAVQALASGGVDACICASDHAIRLANRGQGGKILVALTEHHGYGLVALSTSPAKVLADLKGKKLGITAPGSLTDNTIRYYIKEIGLNPDRDFQLIGVGTGAPMRAALQTGAIAAGMLTTPDVQAALADNGKYKMIQDYRQLQYPALDIVVVQRWLKANDATAKAFAAAIVKAEKLIQTDPAAVKAGVAKMFPALPPAIAQSVTETAPSLIAADGKVAKPGFELMVKMVSLSDATLSPVPYDTVVTTDYLPKS